MMARNRYGLVYRTLQRENERLIIERDALKEHNAGLLKQRDEAVRALYEILSEMPYKIRLQLTKCIKEIAEQGVKEAGA